MALVTLLGFGAVSHAQPLPAQTRGELLYSTHCISCHNMQMHWRNDKQAHDWDSLKFQVRRWQDIAGLQWGEADITEVSRYLNETIYRYPPPPDRVALVSPDRTQPTESGK
jgi:mono/diheme cytochrome c family protein